MADWGTSESIAVTLLKQRRSVRRRKMRRRRLTKQLQYLHTLTVSTHTKSCDSESSGFIASHVLSALRPNEKCARIVDSGATCHMCHDEKSFSALYQIREPV